MTFITLGFSLFPTDEQRVKINRTLEAYHYVCNWAREFEAQSRNSRYAIATMLPQLKEAEPWLREVNAAALQLAAWRANQYDDPVDTYRVGGTCKFDFENKRCRVPSIGWMPQRGRHPFNRPPRYATLEVGAPNPKHPDGAVILTVKVPCSWTEWNHWTFDHDSIGERLQHSLEYWDELEYKARIAGTNRRSPWMK